MDLANAKVIDLLGKEIDYVVVDNAAGLIEVSTTAGDIFQVHATDADVVLPAILEHPAAERNTYGSGNPGAAPEKQFDIFTIAIRPPQGVTVVQPADLSQLTTIDEGGSFRISFTLDSGYENPVLLLNGEPVTLAAPAAGIYTYQIADISADMVVQLRADKIILQTKVEAASASPIKVYATNGYIQVEGTTATPVAYTLSGTLIDATKRLPAGIYIVKVGGETVKVLVQ
jgi:hypothetical protein